MIKYRAAALRHRMECSQMQLTALRYLNQDVTVTVNEVKALLADVPVTYLRHELTDILEGYKVYRGPDNKQLVKREDQLCSNLVDWSVAVFLLRELGSPPEVAEIAEIAEIIQRARLNYLGVHEAQLREAYNNIFLKGEDHA